MKVIFFFFFFFQAEDGIRDFHVTGVQTCALPISCGLPWLPSSDAASDGMYSSDEAKMTGTTPAWLTFTGMYVVAPLYTRRPVIRRVYWTGMRRCACSMKTTNPMTATTTMITVRVMGTPLVR